MCGIAGIIGSDDRSVIERMTRRLAHRGPDDEGIEIFPRAGALGPVSLGHRRLSIIDLSMAGHQPMANEDGTVWVIFNGEIYNFAELRCELERAGHRFRSHTDTEVIVHGYEAWGSACVERFNGMFAFAVLDTRAGELLLARDRMGVKPLYYTQFGGHFAFASEIKALLELDGFTRAIDPVGLDLYLALGYVPWPRSLFANIFKLPPAHILRLGPDAPRIESYWELPAPVPVEESEADQVARLRSLLSDCVAARMVSDVPLGCLLSGGLDSSVTTALLARHRGDGQRLDTFCVGYDCNSRHTEHGYARMVASRLGTRHHEVTCGDEWAINALPRLIWHMDEPLTDDTIAPYARVCELARRDVTVVLSGEGADELLYGYRYYALEKVRRRMARGPAWARKLGQGLLERCGDPESLRIRAARCCLADTAMDAFIEWGTCFNAAERQALCMPGWRRETEGDDSVRQSLRPVGGGGIDLGPGLDTRYRMVDYILNRSDKLSMAVGLELREPLLDYRLVELLAQVPASRKIRGIDGKYLLRQAAEGLLPTEIIRRRKKPFGAPVELWLRPLSDHYLRQSRLVAAGVIAPEPLERLLERPLRGGPVTNQVWALTALEIWYRVFIDQERGTAGAMPASGRAAR